jgi:four helix bundle suffix protein
VKNEIDGRYNAHPSYSSHSSHTSHTSHNSPAPERLLPPRGDYRPLLSFQKAELTYDFTFRFAHKFLSSLINQANYLIDRQLGRLEKKFTEQGGLRTRMTRVRLASRNESRK